ncbi:unnamed protein product [Periconia digitata]|uniref:Uncharacterized protein n=1 Tax=Periconia digitata TaxID=1303443 RepID=A0A9W4XIW0_9PLEO|nr:unnamed protein product [Periconia digitata]
MHPCDSWLIAGLISYLQACRLYMVVVHTRGCAISTIFPSISIASTINAFILSSPIVTNNKVGSWWSQISLIKFNIGQGVLTARGFSLRRLRKAR